VLKKAPQTTDDAQTSPAHWLTAAHAAESKKASDLKVLDLREVTSFADFFILCSGSNPRQIQAIADEVQRQLGEQGEYPNSLEGYDNAEWVLIDYGDYLVHVFSEQARGYYDLERLWRHAKQVDVPPAAP
jgi:ribosome-associated protein